MEALTLKQKKESEVAALEKLKQIFVRAREAEYYGSPENYEIDENYGNMGNMENFQGNYENAAINEMGEPLQINANPKKKKIEIAFWANDRFYKGIFDFRYNNDVLIFTNECSTLEYTYGENYPYMTRINANRRPEPCFTPRLEGPSADVLQILSTKIRLQVPEHEGITIIDEAEKDGVSISKAKLIRGLPSIYEKYGYVSAQIDYIKSQIPLLKVDILPEEAKEILEEKGGLPFRDDMLIIDIMKRISRENEEIDVLRHPTGTPYYISNYIYDIIHNYLYRKFPFALGPIANFKLVFDEGSDAWKDIKDKVLILDVQEVVAGGRRLHKRKRKTNRRQRKGKTKRRTKKN